MAPTAISHSHSQTAGQVDIADLKAKVVAGHVEIEEDHKPPVADNFMYDFKFNHALPTIDVLGVDVPDSVDAPAQADALLQTLEKVLGRGDATGFAEMFLDYGKTWTSRVSFKADMQASGGTSCPLLGTIEHSTSRKTFSGRQKTCSLPPSAETLVS